MALDGSPSEELDAVLSVLDEMDSASPQAEFQPPSEAQGKAEPTGSSTTKSTKSQHGSASRKRGRLGSFDPNRARKERSRELQELRASAQELTGRLAALKAVAAKGRSKNVPASRAPAQTEDRDAKVWEEMMYSQLGQRLEVEMENVRLKSALEESRRIVDNLRDAAFKSSRAMSQRGVGAGLTSKVQALFLDSEADSNMFEMMLKEVDASYHEAPEVFRLNGLSDACREPHFGVQMHESDHGRFMDMFSDSILPFAVADTSRVVWEFYSGPAKHRGQVYFKTTKTINTTHETVVEKFTIEQRAMSMRRDFRVWQVLRRYMEGERALVAWIGIVLPAESSHKPRASVGYCQKGYVLCEPLEQDQAAGSYTRLRRCHRVTPHFPSGSERNLTGKEKREITTILEWNLDLNTIRSHLEHFENVLLGESLQRQAPAN